LIIHSLLTFTILSLWSKNYIYSIIIFLTLIRGLLIIFLYFTSLISNIKNNFTIKLPILLIILINIYIFIATIKSNKYFHLYFKNSYLYNNNLPLNINKKIFENIYLIYKYPHSNLTLICIIFLLLAILLIIKICSIKYAALRKIN